MSLSGNRGICQHWFGIGHLSLQMYKNCYCKVGQRFPAGEDQHQHDKKLGASPDWILNYTVFTMAISCPMYYVQNCPFLSTSLPTYCKSMLMEVLMQVDLYCTIAHQPVQIISATHLYLVQLLCETHYLYIYLNTYFILAFILQNASLPSLLAYQYIFMQKK